MSQKLSTLIQTLMATVGDIGVDKMTVIDHRLQNGGGNFAVNAAVTNEQLKQTLGVDLAAVVRGLAGRGGGAAGDAALVPLDAPAAGAARRRRRRAVAGRPSPAPAAERERLARALVGRGGARGSARVTG